MEPAIELVSICRFEVTHPDRPANHFFARLITEDLAERKIALENTSVQGSLVRPNKASLKQQSVTPLAYRNLNSKLLFLFRRLGAKEIPYEASKDGTSISVPAGRIDEVRLQLASEGLPRSGRQGYEMFDKPNWMGSDFAEKVKLSAGSGGRAGTYHPDDR